MKRMVYIILAIPIVLYGLMASAARAQNLAQSNTADVVTVNYNIGFDRGSSRLTEVARQQLMQIANEIPKSQNTVIRVEGGSTVIGGYEINRYLRYERATVVADFLNGLIPYAKIERGDLDGDYNREMARISVTAPKSEFPAVALGRVAQATVGGDFDQLGSGSAAAQDLDRASRNLDDAQSKLSASANNLQSSANAAISGIENATQKLGSAADKLSQDEGRLSSATQSMQSAANNLAAATDRLKSDQKGSVANQLQGAMVMPAGGNWQGYLIVVLIAMLVLLFAAIIYVIMKRNWFQASERMEYHEHVPEKHIPEWHQTSEVLFGERIKKREEVGAYPRVSKIKLHVKKHGINYPVVVAFEEVSCGNFEYPLRPLLPPNTREEVIKSTKFDLEIWIGSKKPNNSYIRYKVAKRILVLIGAGIIVMPEKMFDQGAGSCITPCCESDEESILRH